MGYQTSKVILPPICPTGNAGSKKLHFVELCIRNIPFSWKLRLRLRPAPRWPNDQKSSVNEVMERAWEAPYRIVRLPLTRLSGCR